MKPVFSIFYLMLLAGCGGGSSAPDGPVNPPGSAMQSPGGQWLGLDSQGRLVNLLISEAGDLRGFVEIGTAMKPPAFTTGTVSVSGSNTVSGEMRGQDILSFPPINLPPGSPVIFPIPTVINCSLSGTVMERTSLSLQIACSDDAALIYDESVTLTLQPGYLESSSLQDIAGNYTFEFKPATNMLNITADGTIFGMYDNGPSCTVNGLVSIIDERYSFLDVSWTFSSCTGFFVQSEGDVYSGFAIPSPDPAKPDSFYFLLTGETSNELGLVSVIYDPT
jgi:hypothetical protein